jgi:hypothetical protein
MLSSVETEILDKFINSEGVSKTGSLRQRAQERNDNDCVYPMLKQRPAKYGSDQGIYVPISVKMIIRR